MRRNWGLVGIQLSAVDPHKSLQSIFIYFFSFAMGVHQDPSVQYFFSDGPSARLGVEHPLTVCCKGKQQ